MAPLLPKPRIIQAAAPVSRRALLGMAFAPVLAGAARAATDGITLRGSIDAGEFGVRAGSADDQRAALQAGIDAAARDGRPLFLAPGRYRTSGLILPSGTILIGVPGSTRLVLQGQGPLLASRGTRSIMLDGLTLDGATGSVPGAFGGLVQFDNVGMLRITGCALLDSPKSALALTGCGGWITQNHISGARDYAAYCLDSEGLTISENEVTDCADGGLLVHGSVDREDGTVVTGNRIQRIGARSGGTGQWGNGINVYRADNVVIANNRVSDCAFSAIRSNGGSDVQIVGNNCLRSGETAIYSEFVFQGAVISGNVVNGAAHGISIANSNENGRLAVCANNLVRNLFPVGPYERDPPGFGTGIWVEADTTVTGNVIEAAPLFALALGWGPYLRNVSATGNVIRDAGVGVAVTVVEGSGKTVIANNVIARARRGAIVGFRWAERVTEDLTITGAEDWPHLLISGNH